MRLLFVLFCISSFTSVSAQTYGGSCDSLDAFNVTRSNPVPEGYTGLAKVCIDGRLAVLANYKDGVNDGLYRRWYEDGQLRDEKNYLDGMPEGFWRTWYENGQLQWEWHHKNGMPDGTVKTWYRNGQLEHEENYKEGSIIDNKVIWYNEDGTVKKTEFYEDGENVKCEGDC